MKPLPLLCAAIAATMIAPVAHANEALDTRAVAAISRTLPDGSFYVFASSRAGRPAYCAGKEQFALLVDGTEILKSGCFIQNAATADVVIRWPDGSYSFLPSDQIRPNPAENR